MRSIFVVGMLLLLMAPAAFSQSPKLAVGASAGLEIPIVQDDQARGSIYGFRLRYQLLPSIAIEPNIYFSKYGDPTSDVINLGIEGSEVTAFGIDAILGVAWDQWDLTHSSLSGSDSTSRLTSSLIQSMSHRADGSDSMVDWGWALA